MAAKIAEKLVLIDGHSILNRAFFGIPDLSNAAGLHTNAIYGFLNIMFKILDEEKPQYLAVAFDVSAPTFRHEIYKEYKGTRKPMAPELKEQVPVMKELLKAMEIPVFEKAGLEADDILGTLAKRAEKKGLEVALVSGDRDLLQIASEHIMIRIPKTRMGKTEIENYYAEDVKNRYQVTPQQFIELKALMGDSSDNIPGVPKVGEKTATELMVTYGSLENLYAHVEEVSKKSIRESLIANRELADLSKVLATINIDADVDVDLEDARIGRLYTQNAYTMFKQLEFKNMLSRFEKADRTESKAIEECIRKITDKKEAEAVFQKVLQQKQASLRVLLAENPDGHQESGGQMNLFETTKTGASMVLALSEGEDLVYYMSSEDMELSYLQKELIKLYENQVHFYSADIKQLYPYLVKEEKTTEQICGQFDDVILEAYLLNPLKNDYDMESIASEYLDLLTESYQQKFGKKKWQDILISGEKAEIEALAKHIAEETYVILKSHELLENKLKETDMFTLYREIEIPLSYVLKQMEKMGIAVDAGALKNYGEELKTTITKLEKQIYEAAGKEFNINSPKQLGEILFEELKLPGGKKTKTGYSTAADVLEKLAPEHPFVADILEYRTYTKLKSTYAEGLSAYIEEDGRIHTNFNQTITATGRISSTEPNLQNIPMRMELGRKIRKVFIPKEGYKFADADYSQIELRILASLAGDKQLIEAYQSGEDIHRITASKVFHVPFEEVTDLQRRNAKAVNFGIVYGISSFGLSQDLSISTKEAKQYIEDYFETYPGIKDYLESAKESAKKNGYSVTMFGRRRPIPELASSNFMQKSFGERVAMNAPIQGTAADIMKIAMIHVYNRLIKEKLQARIVLQIHDELLIEFPESEEKKVLKILEEEMSGAADMAVSLDVEAHSGKDWYEAK